MGVERTQKCAFRILGCHIRIRYGDLGNHSKMISEIFACPLWNACVFRYLCRNYPQTEARVGGGGGNCLRVVKRCMIRDNGGNGGKF